MSESDENIGTKQVVVGGAEQDFSRQQDFKERKMFETPKPKKKNRWCANILPNSKIVFNCAYGENGIEFQSYSIVCLCSMIKER